MAEAEAQALPGRPLSPEAECGAQGALQPDVHCPPNPLLNVKAALLLFKRWAALCVPALFPSLFYLILISLWGWDCPLTW